MATNQLWYPLDFVGQGEEITVLDAIARINTDAINLALASQVKNRQIYWDIIHNQNATTLKSERFIPFSQVGTLPIPPVEIPPSPPPQPTILVTPTDARSIDITEGEGNGSQALRILVTALNDDLTIYGVLPDNRAYWDLDPQDPPINSSDPLNRILSLAELPVVIPKNTWKAFFVTLHPREGTVVETMPFETINVVFILSNAVNTYHSNQGVEKDTADFFHSVLAAYPGHETLQREHFNNYFAVRCYGTVIPATNPGPAQPDTRVFHTAAPFPGIPIPPEVPVEADLGTIGFTISGTDLIIGNQTNTSISVLDFSSETVTQAQYLTKPREWCGAVGNESQFYAAGGSSNNRTTITGTIDRYDMISNAMARISIVLRSGVDMLAGATAKNSGYLFGGDTLAWQDFLTPKYGTVDRIEKIDFTTEFITTLGNNLPSAKALTNNATGNSEKIWLFGGASRNVSSIDPYLFDQLPVNSLSLFTVSSETSVEQGINLAAGDSWRNATAGNRNFVYIAGGCLAATNKRQAAQAGLSSNSISRFNIFDDTLLNIGSQLSFRTDALSPMGGSKKIYFGGGFDDNGFQTRSDIQRLDNLDGLNNETLFTISSQLRSDQGGGAGISDYNAGL